MGYTAYKASQQQTQDTRDVEYRLLAQVTAALIAAKEKTAAYELREKLDAVLWNRDVWAALRVDLSSEGNNLPKELRASLISIAIWIEKESLRLLDGKGDIDAVIDVNRNIMAGLKPHTSEEQESRAQTTQDDTEQTGSISGNNPLLSGFHTAV
jgi:flagellar protein FlaF